MSPTGAPAHRSGGFTDRIEAGRALAAAVAAVLPQDGDRPVVVGLPRGGVPVADEVARALGAEFDVIVVRKLGVPSQAELAMGAIGEEGVLVVNLEVVRLARVSDADLAAAERRERAELERRVRRFRHGRPMVPLAGRTVVVVDDGVATGATARAALQVARAMGARRVLLAVPVAPPSTLAVLRPEADDIVALLTPAAMWAVGAYYRDFSPVPDDEVVRLLDAAHTRTPPDGPVAAPPS